MHKLAILLLTTAAMLSAQAPDEQQAIAAVQRAFDGIAAHDDAMLRSAMLPDARIYAVRDAGAPVNAGLDDLISRVVADKSVLLERFTSSPRVLVRGRIAQVWGEYEFLRGGRVSHCGVDSASLLRTAEGWRIATIVYTAETTGCRGR